MNVKQYISMILIGTSLLFTGCQKMADETKDVEDVVAEENTEDRIDAVAESVTEEENSGTISYPRELSKQELQDFTAWISAKDNYGFLLSEYERPQDINLDEVFYAGAGLELSSLKEEETAAYLEANEQEEIYTDTIRLSTKQIQEFVLEKTGIVYEDMAIPLSWIYLADYDIYVSEHGDTNYSNYSCVSGQQIGEDTYELDCVPGDDHAPSPFSSCPFSSCQVTLKKSENGYQFCSNRFVKELDNSMDIWKIDEQCFETELEGWGEVTFTSYAPNQSVNVNEDAFFALVKEKETVYTFPYVEEENYRRNLRFVKILAISFQDYDNDGDKDIIVINEYEPFINTEEGENLREVRLYQNEPEQKIFFLDTEQMDVLLINGWNQSVEEVLKHIE